MDGVQRAVTQELKVPTWDRGSLVHCLMLMMVKYVNSREYKLRKSKLN